jgi:azurin
MITLRNRCYTTAVLAAAGLLAGCVPGINDVTFELTGGDSMTFSQTSFTAEAPARVTIRFQNVGKMPKIAMGHNLVLLKPGVSPLSFAGRCLSEGGKIENDFLPEAVRGDAVVWSKMLGPGEADTIVTLLSEEGTYHYLCTFPGHAGLMRGSIVVK